MEDMKLQVLKKALSMLDVLGCKYAVLDPDGVEYGTLTVVNKTGITRKRTGMDYLSIYKDRVLAMQPSDTIEEFVPPDGMPIERLRSALTAYCTAKWGKDTYTSQVKDGKVLLMRYA